MVSSEAALQINFGFSHLFGCMFSNFSMLLLFLYAQLFFRVSFLSLAIFRTVSKVNVLVRRSALLECFGIGDEMALKMITVITKLLIFFPCHIHT